MGRNAGLRGLLQAVVTDLPFWHEFAGPVEVPESFDVSHGWSEWLSLGNAPPTGLPGDQLTVNNGQPVGDCFFAAAYHGLITKALVPAGAGKWRLRDGFVLPTADHVVGLYLAFQRGLPPGSLAASGPDNGTEPVAGFEWLRAAGIIKRWWPVDPDRLDAATFQHQGVLTAWALDRDAEIEFEEHKPWLEIPATIDPTIGGHATYRVARDPRYGTEITWAADEQASLDWEQHHLQAAYGFQAPWEPDPAGVDFRPLDEKLAALRAGM